jgi:HupE / UreJ protein
MRNCSHLRRWMGWLLMALGLTGLPSHAHLMVAQKGTLNLSGSGGYLVLSVPVSALQDVDDNADHLLAPDELAAHSHSLATQLSAGIQLNNPNGPLALEGMMFNLSPADGQEGQPADQLIVMGRYALPDFSEPLSFRVSLFGTGSSEQSYSLTVTKNLKEAEVLLLSPAHAEAELYEGPFRVLKTYVRFGFEHVISGFDHLLFLLVVIAAGLTWKKILAVLSLFTVGHALSLATVVFAGLTIPSRIVEPCIAATIVALASYDLWTAKRSVQSKSLRLGLVFGCSLIHGLGLGGALAVLGLQPNHQGATLLGFNLGVETGQLSIALFSLILLAAARKAFGVMRLKQSAWLMQCAAILIGLAWFAQRLVSF